MSAGTDLRTLLLADAAVEALVGKRISADRIDQGKHRPFIVYTQTGRQNFRTLGGEGNSQYTFEVQIWADTRISADEVADAVRAAIEAGENGDVVDEGSAYDGDLDLEAVMLTVEWWA